jgi:N-acetylmuramoyl-L-alanine amidase
MIEISWNAMAVLFTILFNWGHANPEITLHGRDISDLWCLSTNVYHEARGESYEEQIAVSQVVLNRVADARWPDNTCDVVTQKNQFSWYWDTLPDTIHDLGAFKENAYAALLAHTGLTDDVAKGATHYYAHDLIAPPSWATSMTVTNKLGGHTFLK